MSELENAKETTAQLADTAQNQQDLLDEIADKLRRAYSDLKNDIHKLSLACFLHRRITIRELQHWLEDIARDMEELEDVLQLLEGFGFEDK